MSQHDESPETNSNGARIGRYIVGFILLAIGLSWLMSNMFGVIMFVVGMALLVMLANSAYWGGVRDTVSQTIDEVSEAFSSVETAERPSRSRNRRAVERRRAPRQSAAAERERRQAAASQAKAAGRPHGRMHRIAAEAVQRAGQTPDDLTVAPVDIGILVYENEYDTPHLYRETRLPEEVEFVRPFTVLRSPQRARGKIRFELVDGMGTRRFIDETPWELKKGETFVYPDTWLPLENVDDIDGDWKFRIYAAGMLLAEHDFLWHDIGGGDFRGFIDGDGEISDELIDGLSGTNLGRLSLEDLLDEQEGGLIEFDEEAAAADRRNAMINRQQNRRR